MSLRLSSNSASTRLQLVGLSTALRKSLRLTTTERGPYVDQLPCPGAISWPHVARNRIYRDAETGSLRSSSKQPRDPWRISAVQAKFRKKRKANLFLFFNTVLPKRKCHLPPVFPRKPLENYIFASRLTILLTLNIRITKVLVDQSPFIFGHNFVTAQFIATFQ